MESTSDAAARLVLDYFQALGLKSVYDAFAEEAGLPNESAGLYLTQRHELHNLILAGEIRAAVSKLSDVDSALLRDIGYHMQKQALLEILRKNSPLTDTLKYAQVQVAPLAKENPEYVKELESIMSLLLYVDVSQSPDSHYLSNEQRAKTAEIANSALLRYAKCCDRPRLDRVMQAILWAQKTAADIGIKVPKLLDLRTLEFEHEETLEGGDPDSEAAGGMSVDPEVEDEEEEEYDFEEDIEAMESEDPEDEEEDPEES